MNRAFSSKWKYFSMAAVTQDMNIQQGNRLANSGSPLICRATVSVLVLVVLGMTGDFEVRWMMG